jgi:hypothetical protein
MFLQSCCTTASRYAALLLFSAWKFARSGRHISMTIKLKKMEWVVSDARTKFHYNPSTGSKVNKTGTSKFSNLSLNSLLLGANIPTLKLSSVLDTVHRAVKYYDKYQEASACSIRQYLSHMYSMCCYAHFTSCTTKTASVLRTTVEI